MSACFISDSPTRMAFAPHLANRSTSAQVWMPLSATRSGDALPVACCVLREEEYKREASCSVVARSTLNVLSRGCSRRSMPLPSPGRGPVRLRHAPRPALPNPPPSPAYESASTAHRLRLRQSAAPRRRPTRSPPDLPLINDEVLPQQRQVHAPRICFRYFSDPWKNFRSVSTDRQLAPAASYSRAIRTGSKSARITPERRGLLALSNQSDQPASWVFAARRRSPSDHPR